MIININLGTSSLARIGEQKIQLPEKNVCVQFQSDTYILGELVVTVKNDKEEKQYKTTGQPIDITSLCQKAGAIDMEISKMINCKPVKTWRTESLLLCEVTHGMEAIPEIEALKNELNNVKGAIKELAALLNDNEMM